MAVLSLRLPVPSTILHHGIAFLRLGVRLRLHAGRRQGVHISVLLMRGRVGCPGLASAIKAAQDEQYEDQTDKARDRPDEDAPVGGEPGYRVAQIVTARVGGRARSR